MLFDIFAAIGFIGYSIVSACNEGGRLTDAMDEAREKGSYYYYDPKGKQRSLTNREPIFLTHDHRNHRVDMGVKTKRIYADFTQQKADKANEKLKEQGKKWRWVDYGKNDYRAFDPIRCRYFNAVKSADGKSITLFYYFPDDFVEKIDPITFRGEEEVKAWEVPCRNYLQVNTSF